MALKELVVKDENIYFLEVDSNDNFDPAELDEAAATAMTSHNEKFEQDMKSTLLTHIMMNICNCQMPGLMERPVRRQAITGRQGNVELEQDDIDKYACGVLVHSEDGIHKDIVMMTTQCKVCGKMQMFGDSHMFLRAVGESYQGMLPRMMRDEARIADKAAEADVTEQGFSSPAPSFVMEDLETGEKIPADDLAEALFGMKDGSVQLEDTTAKTTEAETESGGQ